jgi:ABC-type hemin transport system substrate-binding protein
MPTPEQIQERRLLKPEQRQVNAIEQIAETLESVEQQLRKIADLLGQQNAAASMRSSFDR